MVIPRNVYGASQTRLWRATDERLDFGGRAMTRLLVASSVRQRLSNHLIGAHAQDRWHREAERLGGLKID
jgi:hypothetical protein